MKIKRLMILALFAKKDDKKFFTAVIDKKLYMISPTVQDMARKGEINEVEFVEDGEVTTLDGTKLPTFKVKDMVESKLSIIDTAIKIKTHAITKEDLEMAISLA